MRTSNISVYAEVPRNIRIQVTGAGTSDGLLVWIDDADDRMPIANIRLTDADARRLVARIADALHAREIAA